MTSRALQELRDIRAGRQEAFKDLVRRVALGDPLPGEDLDSALAKTGYSMDLFERHVEKIHDRAGLIVSARPKEDPHRAEDERRYQELDQQIAALEREHKERVAPLEAELLRLRDLLRATRRGPLEAAQAARNELFRDLPPGHREQVAELDRLIGLARTAGDSAEVERLQGEIARLDAMRWSPTYITWELD